MTTVNPWLALPQGRPSAGLTRRLRAAHETLVTSGTASAHGDVRTVVWDSWRRCLGSGGDPDGTGPPVDLLDGDLLAYREQHPLAGVLPVIRRLLVEDAEDDRMIVAVTDAAGRMLWVEGDPRLRSRAAGMHFVEGARWAEDVAGTNAPGTALAVDHAVQIYGSEHYRRPGDRGRRRVGAALAAPGAAADPAAATTAAAAGPAAGGPGSRAGAADPPLRPAGAVAASLRAPPAAR